ncbi:MAG: hypothetical protein AAGG07_03520 [Planctomycetota bacterium]
MINARCCAAVLVVLAVLVPLESAGQDRPSPPPDDAIAWWSFDPSAFAAAQDGSRAPLEALLRATLAGGLLEGDAADAVAGVLAASVVSGHAHTGALSSLTGEDGEIRFSGAVRVEGIAPEELARTIAAVAARPGSPAAAQRRVTIAGREAVEFGADGWPAWLRLRWASDQDAFVLGIGDGGLTSWFEDTRAAPPWERHRAAVGPESDESGRRLAEVYVNLERAREVDPELLNSDPIGGTFRALRISNARDLMLHARWRERDSGPPLLAIALTWSGRSERPDVIRGTMLAMAEAPGVSEVHSMTGGSYAMVVPVDANLWLSMGMNAAQIGDGPFLRSRFERRSELWFERHAETLQTLVAQTAGVLVLSDDPSPPLPIPGLTTAFVPLASEGPDAAGLLGRVFGSLEMRVAEDAQNRVWFMTLWDDAPEVLERYTRLWWGEAGSGPTRALVIGWSPAAISTARERLGEPAAR